MVPFLCPERCLWKRRNEDERQIAADQRESNCRDRGIWRIRAIKWSQTGSAWQKRWTYSSIKRNERCRTGRQTKSRPVGKRHTFCHWDCSRRKNEDIRGRCLKEKIWGWEDRCYDAGSETWKRKSSSCHTGSKPVDRHLRIHGIRGLWRCRDWDRLL